MSPKDLRLNHWRALEYHDPATILKKLRALEQELSAVDMPAEARRLRTPSVKKYREWRDAAILCHGLGQNQGRHIQYATDESSDYDFVASWLEGATQEFVPVQLKELVPAELNPNATLGALLTKVASATFTDTVLAIKLNRAGHTDLKSVAIPPMRWKQLWFFWCGSPDAQTWCIYGDALAEPGQFCFDYPSA